MVRHCAWVTVCWGTFTRQGGRRGCTLHRSTNPRGTARRTSIWPATVAVPAIVHLLSQEVGLKQPFLSTDGLDLLLLLVCRLRLVFMAATSAMWGVQATLPWPASSVQLLFTHIAHRSRAAWVGWYTCACCPPAQSVVPTSRSRPVHAAHWPRVAMATMQAIQPDHHHICHRVTLNLHIHSLLAVSIAIFPKELQLICIFPLS